MLTLDTIAKTYPNGHLAVSRVSLTVEPGEILAILGGSGCGKSTLLRMIAGLDRPSSGQIVLNGSPIAAPRPEVGVVFQEPRLMPWLTIEENVGFGLTHLPAEKRRARVTEVLDRVGLGRFARAWPKELSGGMAQRAALARALVSRPQVLLLDEPFSALDALTRHDLQDHLLDLWAYDRPTMILVTHDIEEALVLADRVVVMTGQPGRIRTAISPGLPRPRDRADKLFGEWKKRLLADLYHPTARPVRSGEELDPALAI